MSICLSPPLSTRAKLLGTLRISSFRFRHEPMKFIPCNSISHPNYREKYKEVRQVYQDRSAQNRAPVGHRVASGGRHQRGQPAQPRAGLRRWRTCGRTDQAASLRQLRVAATKGWHTCAGFQTSPLSTVGSGQWLRLIDAGPPCSSSACALALASEVASMIWSHPKVPSTTPSSSEKSGGRSGGGEARARAVGGRAGRGGTYSTTTSRVPRTCEQQFSTTVGSCTIQHCSLSCDFIQA